MSGESTHRAPEAASAGPTVARPEAAGGATPSERSFAVPVAGGSRPVVVGRAADPAEAAADAAAARALLSLDVPGGVARRSATPGPDALGGTAVPAPVLDVLGRRRGGGSPLPPEVAATMGAAFGGRDFRRVRVHLDGEADALTRSLDATAFTHGNDVYFSEGAYDPGSAEGQHLLAHELAHTIDGGPGIRRTKRRVTQPRRARADGATALRRPQSARDARRAARGTRRSPRARTAAFDPGAFRAAFLAHVPGQETADTPQAADRDAERILERVRNPVARSLNCVAVFTKDRQKYLASNAPVPVPRGYTVVPNGVAMKHAEMVLLDRFGARAGYFGISKRCCRLCAHALWVAGVGHRGDSGAVYSTGWAIPDFISGNQPRLRQFLGEPAWALYSTYSAAAKASALQQISGGMLRGDER